MNRHTESASVFSEALTYVSLTPSSPSGLTNTTNEVLFSRFGMLHPHAMRQNAGITLLLVPR